MPKTAAKSLPKRSAVKVEDTWDLGSLFESDGEWEKAFGAWAKRIKGYDKFRGRLGESAKTLAACLQFDADLDREGDRIGTYAFLRTSEDQGNSEYQRMKGRYMHAATRASELASYVRPEIMRSEGGRGGE